MIDQTITTPPPAPSSNDIPNFKARFDAFLAWMVVFVSQLVTLVSQINSTATTVNNDATTASNAKDAAVASANFQGTWTNQTTQVGESYLWNGAIYMVLVAGNTSPTTSPSNWMLIPKINSVNGFTPDASGNVKVEATKGTAIASASTITIGTVGLGDTIHITGTTTITSLGACTGGVKRTLIFDGILTLTHNATSLILPDATNITTAVGDSAEFVCDTTNNWKLLRYTRATTPTVKVTPQVRQTVLSGAVDTSGFSAFGGATGSTTVTASSTLEATCADGTNDRIGTIVNPSWTGLSTNGTIYLYLDIATDETCTTGKTTLSPTYRWGGADVVTNLQNTFNIQEMKMKVGNGLTASQVYRVFVGEVMVAGGVVTAITWYALMGRYDSGLFSTSTSTTYPKNHNIGIQAIKMLIRWADDINGTNERWAQPLGVNAGFLGSASTRNSQSVLTLGTASGYDITGNGANPYYRMLCERGW